MNIPQNANGQATMANSSPVVLASDQASIPVTVSGVATAANQTTGNTSLGTIAGAVAGSEMQVDVITMPTVTVTATNLDVQSGGADLATTTQAGAIQTAVQLLDDTVAVLGTDTYTEASSKGLIMGGVRRDADTTLVNTTNEFAPFQVDANGYLKVEVFSGQTLPVSFTGSGDVATQTTLASVLTSVQLIDDTVFTDDTSTHSTGTTKGLGMMAVANPTDAAVDANDIGMPAMTLARALKNDITSIAGTAAVSGSGNATGALRVELANNGTGTLATVSTVTTVSTLSNTTQLTPGTAATNLGKARDSAIGATDTGVAMLGVRRDSPTAETPAAGDYVVPQYSANGEAWVRTQGELADDAAFTVGTTRVQPIGLLADETSTDSVDEGDLGAPRMTLDRKQIATLYPASGTTDGLSVANFNSGDTFTALTATAQVIKASAGNFYGYYIYNPNSAATYVILYNIAAASVTVGTSTPAMVFCIPATAGANLSLPYPIPFTNAGWSIAATTTGGGNTAPATALEVMIYYR